MSIFKHFLLVVISAATSLCGMQKVAISVPKVKHSVKSVPVYKTASAVIIPKAASVAVKASNPLTIRGSHSAVHAMQQYRASVARPTPVRIPVTQKMANKSPIEQIGILNGEISSLDKRQGAIAAREKSQASKSSGVCDSAELQSVALKSIGEMKEVYERKCLQFDEGIQLFLTNLNQQMSLCKDIQSLTKFADDTFSIYEQLLQHIRTDKLRIGCDFLLQKALNDRHNLIKNQLADVLGKYKKCEVLGALRGSEVIAAILSVFELPNFELVQITPETLRLLRVYTNVDASFARADTSAKKVVLNEIACLLYLINCHQNLPAIKNAIVAIATPLASAIGACTRGDYAVALRDEYKAIEQLVACFNEPIKKLPLNDSVQTVPFAQQMVGKPYVEQVVMLIALYESLDKNEHELIMREKQLKEMRVDGFRKVDAFSSLRSIIADLKNSSVSGGVQFNAGVKLFLEGLKPHVAFCKDSRVLTVFAHDLFRLLEQLPDNGRTAQLRAGCDSEIQEALTARRTLVFAQLADMLRQCKNSQLPTAIGCSDQLAALLALFELPSLKSVEMTPELRTMLLKHTNIHCMEVRVDASAKKMLFCEVVSLLCFLNQNHNAPALKNSFDALSTSLAVALRLMRCGDYASAVCVNNKVCEQVIACFNEQINQTAQVSTVPANGETTTIADLAAESAVGSTTSSTTTEVADEQAHGSVSNALSSATIASLTAERTDLHQQIEHAVELLQMHDTLTDANAPAESLSLCDNQLKKYVTNFVTGLAGKFAAVPDWFRDTWLGIPFTTGENVRQWGELQKARDTVRAVLNSLDPTSATFKGNAVQDLLKQLYAAKLVLDQFALHISTNYNKDLQREPALLFADVQQYIDVVNTLITTIEIKNNYYSALRFVREQSDSLPWWQEYCKVRDFVVEYCDPARYGLVKEVMYPTSNERWPLHSVTNPLQLRSVYAQLLHDMIVICKMKQTLQDAGGSEYDRIRSEVHDIGECLKCMIVACRNRVAALDGSVQLPDFEALERSHDSALLSDYLNAVVPGLEAANKEALALASEAERNTCHYPWEVERADDMDHVADFFADKEKFDGEIIPVPTDEALLDYGVDLWYELQLPSAEDDLRAQLESAIQNKKDFDSSYAVIRCCKALVGSDAATFKHKIGAIAGLLAVNYESKKHLEQCMEAVDTILEVSGETLVHHIHELTDTDLDRLAEALNLVAHDRNIVGKQALCRDMMLRRQLVADEGARRGFRCKLPADGQIVDLFAEAQQFKKMLNDIKSESAPAWLYSRWLWSPAKDFTAQWPAYCKIFTKIEGLIGADEQQRLAQNNPDQVASSEYYQQIYDDLRRDQLVCHNARAILYELWQDKNWAACNPQLAVLDKLFERCAKELDGRCHALASRKTLDGRALVTPRSLERVAEDEAMALHRKNIDYRRTFGHFVKSCVKNFIFSYAYISAELLTADYKQWMATISVGGFKQFVFEINVFGTNTEINHQELLRKTKELQQRLEERKAREEAEAAWREEVVQAAALQLEQATDDSLQQQIADLKKHAAEDPDTKNSNSLNFFAERAQQLMLIGQKKRAQGSSKRSQELLESGSVVIKLGQALQEGDASRAAELVATMQPIIEEAATAEGAKQELLLDVIKAGTLGIEMVQALEAIGAAELAEFCEQLLNTKLEGLQELVDSYDGAPTPAGSNERRLAELEQEIAELGELDTLQIMRGEVDCCQRIQGKVAVDLAKVYLAFGKGFVKGGLAACDPRTTIAGFAMFGKVAIFALQQIDRLDAAAEAIRCGDYRRAEQLHAEYDAANARVVQAVKDGCHAFMQMPAEQRGDFFGNFISSLAFAKPGMALQLQAAGKVLDVAGTGAKLAGKGCNIARLGALKKIEELVNKLGKNPLVQAETAEGINVAVNVAEDAEGLAGASAADEAAAKFASDNIRGGQKVAEAVQWTNHGHKHFPKKNMAWKDIVTATKTGDAMYHPNIVVESFERAAWDNGIMCNNGKLWKVMKFDHVVGAKNGIETNCVLIKYSANTIHGHPITPAEYLKYLKLR